MRGTSAYNEESKKNLISMLRQFGGQNLFLTLSMAEFQWDSLFKEIVETVYRRKFSKEELGAISNPKRNKSIADNNSFQKRLEKIFSLMRHQYFFGQYTVSQFYFRTSSALLKIGLRISFRIKDSSF